MDLIPTPDPQLGTLTKVACISCNPGTTCYCCNVPDTSESSPFTTLINNLSALPPSERDPICIRFLNQLSSIKEGSNDELKLVPKETDSKSTSTVDESIVLPLTPPSTPKATFGESDVSSMADSSAYQMDVSFERFIKSVTERDERTLATASPKLNSSFSRDEQPVMSYFINPFPKVTTPSKVTPSKVTPSKVTPSKVTTPRKSAKVVPSSPSSRSTHLTLTPRKEVTKQTDTKRELFKVDKPKRTLPRSGPPPTHTVSCPVFPPTAMPPSPVFSSLQHLIISKHQSLDKKEHPLEGKSESTKLPANDPQSPVINWQSVDSLKSTAVSIESTGISFDCPAVISQESTAAVSPEPAESPKDGCSIM